MVWINSAISVDDVLAQRNNVFEILIARWGDTVVANDPDGTNLVFPPINSKAMPALGGLAIGPRSTVDRVWVSYSLQKLVPSASLWDFARRVSVKAPLAFSQPATQNVVPTAVFNTTSSLVITTFAGTLTEELFQFGNTYVKADGSTATFGTTVPNAAYNAPLLHLYAYLGAPPPIIPTSRFPLYQTGQVTTAGAGAGVEKLAAQFPVSGRRTIIVYTKGSAAADVRVGLIDNFFNMREATVASAAAVASTTTSRFVINPALGEYLMIYYNNVADGATFAFETYATDE